MFTEGDTTEEHTYTSRIYILNSVPSSCTLCQTVLIVSSSDKKYRFGVPFEKHRLDVLIQRQTIESRVFIN